MENKKKIKLLDVSKKAGFSTTTVSQALNNVKTARISPESRAKILETAKELGYVPDQLARSLVLGKTNIIGLVISGFISPFSTPFYSEFIRGVGLSLEKNNYYLLIIEPKKDDSLEEIYAKTAGNRLIEGLIIDGNYIKDSFIIRLNKENYPFVVSGREIPGIKINCVTQDYYNGAYNATKYFIKKEHKNICFIGGPNNTEMTNLIDREIGYREALKDNSLIIREELMLNSNDITIEEGYRLMNKVLSFSSKTTAVLAANDLLAIGAMNAIKEHKLNIPGDIAVIGFDDFPESSIISPKLSTLKYDLLKNGETLGDLLIEFIKNKNISKNIVMQPSLIIRESSG